ncbi:MAG: PorT family protein [Bacteroidetes bacterium]|nr:PorT family protein [Bacteroidota bacterium]
MVRFISFLFLVLLSTAGLSQSADCEQTLNQASAEFDAGRFYNLPGILKPCLDNGFSKEQKVRSYLLLTQSYLILNDPIAAENSYLQLLTADPEFVTNPSRDPVDVYYLSKKFTTTPVFTPSFRAGINTSLPRTIYSINTIASPTNDENVYKIGYQLGGALDWNLNERWSICFGLGYSRRLFKVNLSNADAGMKNTFIEKQDWIDIPVFVKYSDDSGRVRPFVYAGISANLLLGAKLSAEAIDFNSPSTGVQQVSQGPDVPITYKRNFFNRSVVIGGGAKYKVAKNFLFVDVRYLMGLNNIAKNTYTDSNGQFDKLLADYPYASDLFRLDNLSFTIGYIKPLYDPRKRKPAVAGILQKLGLKKSRKK